VFHFTFINDHRHALKAHEQFVYYVLCAPYTPVFKFD
jgi:hypothetical protein